MASDKDKIAAERDKALVELERLTGKLELLKDAAVYALEYLCSAPPHVDLGLQRHRVVTHLGDALEACGLHPLEFEIRSDAN